MGFPFGPIMEFCNLVYLSSFQIILRISNVFRTPSLHECDALGVVGIKEDHSHFFADPAMRSRGNRTRPINLSFARGFGSLRLLIDNRTSFIWRGQKPRMLGSCGVLEPGAKCMALQQRDPRAQQHAYMHLYAGLDRAVRIHTCIQVRRP